MKRGAAHPEWVVDVLVRASTEAVERDGKTFYTKLGHADQPPMSGSRIFPRDAARESQPASAAPMSGAVQKSHNC